VAEQDLRVKYNEILKIKCNEKAGFAGLSAIVTPHHDRKAEAQIPTDGRENHLRLKWAPLEQTGN
jgi:hypothetical protein